VPARRLLFLLTLGAWLLSASSAAGHSVIAGSDPPANASVDAAPRQLILRVTEAIEPAFSSVTVTDRSGRRVSGRPSYSQGRRRVTVPLTDLTRGVFLVKWRLLSAIDGHTSSGVYLFAVGQPLAPGGAGGAGTPDRAYLIVRWLGYLAAIVLAGSTFFPVAVLRPALRRLGALHDKRTGGAVERRLRTLTVIAALVLLAVVVAEALLGAASLLDAPMSKLVSSGGLWAFLVGTRPGISAALRFAMVLLLLMPARTPGWLRWLALVRPEPAAPGAVVLGAMTFTAHAAGEGAPALIADWIHLLAAALWVGGLASLAIVLAAAAPADRGALARALVPRFSTVAGVGLGVVALTGVYGTWLQLPSIQAFATTAYGRALAVKLLLVALIIALGALNRFVLVPRLRAPDGSRRPVVHRLLRSVSVEIGLGAGVLAAVAVLTATPPARVTQAPASERPLAFAGTAGDVRTVLTIAPAKPGWNRFEAHVTARGGGQSAPDDARVLLRLTELDENLDVATVALSHQGQGRYLAEGGELAVPGWWQVEMVVRRRGRLDVSAVFPLVPGQRPAASDPAAKRLLEAMRATIPAWRSWRQVELLTDGAGHSVETQYDVVQPDRLRYRTSEGGEVVFVGPTRYMRRPEGGWDKDSLSPLRVADGITSFLDGAERVARGRTGVCDAEPCQVVLWNALGGAASFAGWIGLETHRLHALLMFAPVHYMTERYVDVNVPLSIVPPRH